MVIRLYQILFYLLSLNVPRHRPGIVMPKRPKQVSRSDRSKEHARFLNSTSWRAASKKNLRDNPFCVVCYSNGQRVEAKHTDHIIPTNQGGSHYDSRNLQPLCVAHHSAKTMRENRGETYDYKLNESGDKIPL